LISVSTIFQQVKHSVLSVDLVILMLTMDFLGLV